MPAHSKNILVLPLSHAHQQQHPTAVASYRLLVSLLSIPEVCKDRLHALSSLFFLLKMFFSLLCVISNLAWALADCLLYLSQIVAVLIHNEVRIWLGFC